MMLTAQDLQLTGHRLFDSNDVEDIRSRISAVLQPHHLAPRCATRNLHAYMDFVDIAGLGLGAIRFGPMRVRLDQVDGYYLLIFCRQGAGWVRSGREEHFLTQQRGVCLPPGAPLTVDFSEDCEQFVLRIGPELFRKHTGQPNPSLPRELDLTKPFLQSWARVLWSISSYPDPVRQQAKIAMDYQRLLLGMLVQAGTSDRQDVRSTAPGAVKRAEAYILENASRPICLEDIVQAADVPARTLLNSFRRFRDISPMSFLRDVRLAQVRKRLVSPAENKSVTDVALEEGFAHLGRFSSEYAARYGERPSDTLRASRLSVRKNAR